MGTVSQPVGQHSAADSGAGQFKILAAPLQGYTENAFRLVHAATVGGIAEYFIPFVRLYKQTLSLPDVRQLVKADNPDSAVPQILVADAAETSELCRLIADLGYQRIDINFGCPFVKVTAKGYGCGILARPEQAAAVLAVLAKFPQIRFSLKMRTGLQNRDDWQKLLPAINEAALVKVILHPRTGADGYVGALDEPAFAEFSQACTHPVYWNGEVRTAAQAAELRQKFVGLPGLMLGRGLLSEPTLALAIGGKTFDRGREIKTFYAGFLAQLAHREQPLSKLKSFWDYFLPEAPKRERKKLLKSRTWDEAVIWSEKILEDLG